MPDVGFGVVFGHVKERSQFPSGFVFLSVIAENLQGRRSNVCVKTDNLGRLTEDVMSGHEHCSCIGLSHRLGKRRRSLTSDCILHDCYLHCLHYHFYADHDRVLDMSFMLLYALSSSNLAMSQGGSLYWLKSPRDIFHRLYSCMTVCQDCVYIRVATKELSRSAFYPSSLTWIRSMPHHHPHRQVLRIPYICSYNPIYYPTASAS